MGKYSQDADHSILSKNDVIRIAQRHCLQLFYAEIFGKIEIQLTFFFCLDEIPILVIAKTLWRPFTLSAVVRCMWRRCCDRQ